MAKTKLWAIFLMICVTLVTTVAQLCYKYGMNNISEIYGFFILMIGMVLYCIGAVAMIVALRGGELSILYPILALSYIWVSILSPMFFSADSMSPLKWAGVFLIIIGISLIGKGMEKDRGSHKDCICNDTQSNHEEKGAVS